MGGAGLREKCARVIRIYIYNIYINTKRDGEIRRYVCIHTTWYLPKSRLRHNCFFVVDRCLSSFFSQFFFIFFPRDGSCFGTGQ